MTRRLYYTDAYLTRFDARVEERADGGRRVYLDQSAFYPTSGGQPHDLGDLAGISVQEVVDEGDRVAHLLAAPLPDAGVVSGEVAWPRRFDHMQQHTGQHLLSAVFADLFGYATLSVHFGAELSTVDLEVESLPREQLLAAEARANALVAEDRPVTVSFEEAATATGLRKPSDRAGTLRIVTIDGVDRSACGGTHVRATGEIGAVLLRRVERIRKATRVEFACGMRAVRRARADFESLSAAAAALSAGIDELAPLVEAQATQLRESDNARRRLEKELAEYRARELYDATAADADGVRRVVQRRDSGGDELRSFAQAFTSLPRSVLAAVVADPPSVLLATSADSGMDAGRTLKALLADVGGRGGGSPRLAQGSVPSADLLAAISERLATPS